MAPASELPLRIARRRVREALRWQRHAIDAGRCSQILPERYEVLMRELRAEAFAEVIRRDALGLSRPRSLAFHGVRFELRYVWGGLVVIDPRTRVSVRTRYGAL